MAKSKSSPTKLKSLGLIALSTITGGFLTLTFKGNTKINVPAYHAVRVIDGDTFETTEKQWIRISGIDAPETGMCGSKEAKQALEKLILNKDIYLKVTYHDSTRLMAIVYTKDGLVATKMISSGRAEFINKDDYKIPEMAQASKYAQSQKLGLFGPPCTQETNPQNPKCLIKGNNTTLSGPTYHLPGCNSYAGTKVQLHHGDQWFFTEEEAIKAGYTKAKNCPDN